MGSIADVLSGKMTSRDKQIDQAVNTAIGNKAKPQPKAKVKPKIKLNVTRQAPIPTAGTVNRGLVRSAAQPKQRSLAEIQAELAALKAKRAARAKTESQDAVAAERARKERARKVLKNW